MSKIKEIIAFPAVMILLVTFATQMADIAESTSEKAVYFAEDMENAIDCAAVGIDMKECSPRLFNHNFKKDLDEFKGELENAQEKIKSTQKIKKDPVQTFMQTTHKEIKYSVSYDDDFVFIELK